MLAFEESVAAAATDVPPQRQRSLARAARHAILRRLAPPLRHDLVVPLQSLGLMAEALSARLERGALPPDEVQDMVGKLNRLARQAIANCVAVSGWMEPAEDDAVPLHEGLAECARLLTTGLGFRGFELRLAPPEGAIDVSRFALRFLLPGAILALVDAAPAPGELRVHAEAASGQAVLQLEYAPQPDAAFPLPHDAGATPLAWAELQALAAEEGAGLLRQGSTILLRLPRALVTTPLALAPV